jgi:hypothetical protein
MRIYKGTETTLNLFFPACAIEAYQELSVVLYTTNPDKSIKLKNVKVEGNLINVKVKEYDFTALEDGVIKYIVLGDEISIATERQSNYFLKTPSNYTATEISAEPYRELVVIENGEYTITPNKGYMGIEEVKVIVDLPIEEIQLENYNKGYSEGYAEGESDGYNGGYSDGLSEGYAEGVEDQKEKLDSISITTNGTYEKEDGYNHIIVEVPDLNGSYDEGYSDGYIVGEDVGYSKGVDEAREIVGEEIAQTARVLDITENGIYTSQYTQDDDYRKPEIVTGVFGDGTYFYDYANFNYETDTKITTSKNTKIKVWYKYPDVYNNYIVTTKLKGLYSFYIRSNNNKLCANIANQEVSFSAEKNKWYCVELSYADGFCINGVKIADFSNNLNMFDTIYIGTSNEQNTIGMVIIDDHIFIPRKEGFYDVTTEEYLTHNDGFYQYFNNFTEPVVEGNLIRTINVNVPPKLSDRKINFGYSTFDKIPDGLIDWKKITNMNFMFRECTQLTDLGDIDTSNVTLFDFAFYNCLNLSDFKNIDLSNALSLDYTFSYTKIDDETIAKFNTANVTNMRQTFANCSAIKVFPSINTSNVTIFNSLLSESLELEEVMPIDTSKAIDMQGMFYSFGGEHKLRKLPEFECGNVLYMNTMFSYYQDRMDYFTDCGGWKNLKCNWNDNYGLRACANLSYESCINILNGLADVTTIGSRTLKVHQNFLDLVGDKISIATAKNWVITT